MQQPTEHGQAAPSATLIEAGTRPGVEVPQGTNKVPQVTESVSSVTNTVTQTIEDVVRTQRAHVKRAHETSGSSESSESFRITKSASSRGRPKVRQKQKHAQKKQRMKEERAKANKLVQGKLAPVQSVHRMLAQFDVADSYEDAQRGLAVISECTIPKSKKAIAGNFADDECEVNIRYVFPEEFVMKAQSAIRTFGNALRDGISSDGIGVRVPRFGVYSQQDINAMNRWHTAMSYVTETTNAIKWALHTSIKRVEVPPELEDGVSEVPENREAAFKRIPLRGERSTSLGSLLYRALRSFCENNWMDDAAMCHGLVLLQRENAGVGVVDPIFQQLPDEQVKVAPQANPFQEGNDVILIPMHVDGNHWCGIVIDFRAESREITICVPL
ncbi:hypothetical protein PPTG_18826 [Phytophthora nicotianae INRA-310]|uniref:Ubiquitin-like protease family profile domain-containing protein n=1 Tax=Phytophthora nicotianae (strain INRA-310) TaxID=761204 RepID=W2PFB6_PHYN3|nr:hypothetical protein PPTG_18826 [Phytophthora nicotianae INRA-310]ETM99556.1 hypothetical protein PPTG_18826 [Phytophthora nicotianae INRA-310]